MDLRINPVRRPVRGYASWLFQVWIVLTGLAFSVSIARAQSCQISGDLDDTTRAALTAAGQRYFDIAAKGDAATLRQNAVASLASDFSGIEATVKDHQQDFAGGQTSAKAVFLLEAAGDAPLPHAEFYCGVFGKNGQTSGSAVFYLDNLQPGTYAVIVFDVVGASARNSFSVILQQAGAGWKLAGLYLKPAQVAGHDSEWFAARAREYKAKGQLHNAWLFYLQARSLISPLPFMSTLATDTLYDELQSVQPADVPVAGKTATLPAGATTYTLTVLFPEGVGNDLDLIVKYQVADASNTTQAYQSNLAVIKALVTKYPEVRDAFAAVVARALDPSGRDFGTLLAMKDIK
ncbi:MAG: hypothetical protein ACLQBK_24945 [Candidatus Sulfotelmatobacter sp.]